MSADTVPAAVPMPPEPPHGMSAATGNDAPTKGFLASMVAAVEPARPTTFDLAPTAGPATVADTGDGVLDRSAPGMTSASFRDAEDVAGKDPSGEKLKAQGSIWKAWWLASAQRWAKGGGTANKRLDVRKAKAQSHQVKEARTTAVTNSGGLPVRNSTGSGAGGGSKGNDRKSASGSRGKGPVNSSGNRSSGSGRGGSGGGHGSGGGSGSNGAHRGGAGKQTGGHDKNSPAGAGKNNAGHDQKQPKGPADKGSGKSSGTGAGGSGKQGSGGKNGAAGKDGKSGDPRTSGPGPTTAPGKDRGKQQDTRTPLEKSRETGHKDGSNVRNAIDHVKAYTDGARDGYLDKRDENAKDHTRLDKAHADHKTKDGTKGDDTTKAGRPQAAIVTEKEDDGVTTDVKPLTVQNIDANTLTLGTDGARSTVGRRELRNFKQYERKLEAKQTILHRIAEACAQLQGEAENEAKDCQQLAEQAKGVKGGEKLVGKLNRLAEAAKNQAIEAVQLAKRAKRAAEMCKVVLTNIQTRYAPLYKAVQDSDETKPAELRFYNDKGSYAPAA